MRRRNRGVLVLVSLLLVVLVVSLPACKAQPTAAEPVKVGATLPLNTAVGQGQLGGIEIAIAEGNAAGGIKGRQIQFVYYNDEGNTEKITSNVERLITVDKSVIIVGASYSAHGIAAGSVCTSKSVPLISCSASTDALDKEAWVFRVHPNATNQIGSSLVQAKKLGAKNVVLLWVNSAWGVGNRDIIVSEAPKQGVTLVGNEGVEQGATDVTVQLNKLKALKPDIILATIYEKELIAALMGLKSLGWNVPFMDAGGLIEGIIEATDPRVLEGVYTLGRTDFRKPISVKLMDAYEKKYGKRWEYGHIIHGYDAGRVAIEALKLADNPDNPTAVRDAIRKVKIELALGRPNTFADFSTRNWNPPAEQLQWYVIKSGKAVVVD